MLAHNDLIEYKEILDEVQSKCSDLESLMGSRSFYNSTLAQQSIVEIHSNLMCINSLLDKLDQLEEKNEKSDKKNWNQNPCEMYTHSLYFTIYATHRQHCRLKIIAGSEWPDPPKSLPESSKLSEKALSRLYSKLISLSLKTPTSKDASILIVLVKERRWDRNQLKLLLSLLSFSMKDENNPFKQTKYLCELITHFINQYDDKHLSDQILTAPYDRKSNTTKRSVKPKIISIYLDMCLSMGKKRDNTKSVNAVFTLFEELLNRLKKFSSEKFSQKEIQNSSKKRADEVFSKDIKGWYIVAENYPDQMKTLLKLLTQPNLPNIKTLQIHLENKRLKDVKNIFNTCQSIQDELEPPKNNQKEVSIKKIKVTFDQLYQLTIAVSNLCPTPYDYMAESIPELQRAVIIEVCDTFLALLKQYEATLLQNNDGKKLLLNNLLRTLEFARGRQYYWQHISDSGECNLELYSRVPELIETLDRFLVRSSAHDKKNQEQFKELPPSAIKILRGFVTHYVPAYAELPDAILLQLCRQNDYLLYRLALDYNSSEKHIPCDPLKLFSLKFLSFRTSPPNWRVTQLASFLDQFHNTKTTARETTRNNNLEEKIIQWAVKGTEPDSEMIVDIISLLAQNKPKKSDNPLINLLNINEGGSFRRALTSMFLENTTRHKIPKFLNHLSAQGGEGSLIKSVYDWGARLTPKENHRWEMPEEIVRKPRWQPSTSDEDSLLLLIITRHREINHLASEDRKDNSIEILPSYRLLSFCEFIITRAKDSVNYKLLDDVMKEGGFLQDRFNQDQPKGLLKFFNVSLRDTCIVKLKKALRELKPYLSKSETTIKLYQTCRATSKTGPIDELFKLLLDSTGNPYLKLFQLIKDKFHHQLVSAFTDFVIKNNDIDLIEQTIKKQNHLQYIFNKQDFCDFEAVTTSIQDKPIELEDSCDFSQEYVVTIK